MMVSLYAMLDFVYMITGKIVWGLLVIGFIFLKWKKRDGLSELPLISPTEDARIDAAGTAAAEQLNRDPLDGAQGASDVEKFAPCTLLRTPQKSISNEEERNHRVYPTRKGDTLYLHKDEACTTLITALPLRQMQIEMVAPPRKTVPGVPEEPLKDGNLFGKGKAVKLYRAKKQSSSRASQEGTESEGARQQSESGAEMQRSSSKRTAAGERVLPVVPITDEPTTEVPEPIRAGSAAASSSTTVNSTASTPVVGSSSTQERPYFFHFKQALERAAFFESILKHSHDAPTIALVHQDVNMERLRDKCNKLAPGAEAVVNALLGRILLAFAPTEFLQQIILEKIHKKTGKVVEEFGMVTSINIVNLRLGTTTPIFSNLKLDAVDPDGTIQAFAHIDYTSAADDPDAVLHALVEIQGPVYGRILVDGRLKHISGDLRIKIPPFPSNRIWYGFTSDPDIKMELVPQVFGAVWTWNSVSTFVKGLMMKGIRETVVLPNMDDLAFFNTTGKRVRGGIFDDSVAEPVRARYAEVLEKAGATRGQTRNLAGSPQSGIRANITPPIDRPDARQVSDANGLLPSSNVSGSSEANDESFQAYMSGVQDGAEAVAAGPNNRAGLGTLAQRFGGARPGWLATLQAPGSVNGGGNVVQTVRRQFHDVIGTSSIIDRAEASSRPASGLQASSADVNLAGPGRTEPSPERSIPLAEGEAVTRTTQPRIDTSVSTAQIRTSPASSSSTSSRFSWNKREGQAVMANLTSRVQTNWRMLRPQGERAGVGATGSGSTSRTSSADTTRSPQAHSSTAQAPASAAGPSGHVTRSSLDDRRSLQDRLASVAHEPATRSAVNGNGRPRSDTASSIGSTSSARPSLLSSPSKAPSPAPVQTTSIPQLAQDGLVREQPIGQPSMRAPRLPSRPQVISAMDHAADIDADSEAETMSLDTVSVTSTVPPPLQRNTPPAEPQPETSQATEEQGALVNGSHMFLPSDLDTASAGPSIEGLSGRSQAEEALRNAVAKQEAAVKAGLPAQSGSMQ